MNSHPENRVGAEDFHESEQTDPISALYLRRFGRLVTTKSSALG